MIKEYLQRIKERKQRLKDAQDDYNIQKKITERQKSSNERELEKFKEEDRQERIKNELNKYRKRQTTNLYYNSGILNNNKNLFKNDDDHNIMKQKNIFSGGSTILR